MTLSIDTSGYNPGAYTLVAFTDGTLISYPLARLVFTVTAASAPGLPNTGHGHAAPGATMPGFLPGLGVAALAAFVDLGGMVALRRRAP